MAVLPNTDSKNDASDHYGSIQVVSLEPSDESLSLLQHRHHVPPTTSRNSFGQSPPPLNEGSNHSSTVASSPLHYLKKYGNAYLDMVEKRPLVTKSITATFILGGADLCAQGLEHARHLATVDTGVDWPRAGRFALFGFFGAPWSHYYFHALDTCLPPIQPEQQPCCSPITVLKVCIDQFIQAPILLAMMISMLSILKGQGIEGVRHDLHENFWNALVANCTLYSCCCFLRNDLYPRLKITFAVNREIMVTSISNQHALC